MEKTENSLGITEVTKGDVVIIRIKGKLDANLSMTIEKKAIDYTNQGLTKILFNLSDTSYINSAGLRMLLSIKKQVKTSGGKFIVCGLNSEVTEIMKICGFDHVLEITKSEEDAVRQF